MSHPTDSLRVLHVLAPSRQGGAERVVTMLSALQQAKGVHVAAILSPADVANHPFVVALKTKGTPVTVVEVPGRRYVREYRALNDLVARLSPVIIHTHGYHADVVGGAVAKARGLQAVSTVHGFVGGGLRNLVYERIQLLALRRADAVLAVSLPLVDRLTKAGVPQERVHFVPNGFMPFASGLTRSAARRELGLAGNGPIAGWVGRLSLEKGADVMLDAIAACSPPWRLSIIGDGPERERLKQQAKKLGITDRVTWHGPISNAGALLSGFDAFVLSSRTEGTPIVLFEAMHSGVPIVTTGVGGVPDVVSSAEAILVPPEDPAMIASALCELLKEPAAATRRSLLARERVIRDFGAEAWAAAVEEVYRSIASRS